MPQISVIVPVYKVEKYLGRCVESILTQTFEDFELILVDDGSTDRSGEICDEYAAKDDRIRVIHKQNGGVSSARNAGLDAAQGEFVAFVDSDDYVEPDYLQVLCNHNVDLSFCGSVRHLEDGSIKDNLIPTVDKGKNEKKLLQVWLEKGYLCSVWAKLIRKSIINSLRFREDMCYGEDSVFVMSIANRCNTYFCTDKIMYHYVKYDSLTLTKSFSKKHVLSYDALLMYHAQWKKEAGISLDCENLSSSSAKLRLKNAFFVIFENEEISWKEKLNWYRLFFSLKSFAFYMHELFAEYSVLFNRLITLRSPIVLVMYEGSIKLRRKFARKKGM